MTEEKKKIGVGKGCLIALGILIALAVLGSLLGGGDGSTTSETQQAASEPPLPVTAKALEKAYADNEAAAQQQYGNRRLLVSGTINKIQLDYADKPFVVLEGENMFMGPQIHLVEAAQPLAAQMQKGQKITFLCAGVGEVVGTPMLKDCSIADGAK